MLILIWNVTILYFLLLCLKSFVPPTAFVSYIILQSIIQILKEIKYLQQSGNT